MAFHVHSAGAHSLIVDEGRSHCRDLGLPAGGAADRMSFALGNALAGNPVNTPALEIALAGPSLEADDHHALVVFGAPFAVHLNEQPQVVGRTFHVRPGDRITIGTSETGLRAYVGVPGGFESKQIMGSRSNLSPIRGGQSLGCAPSQMRVRWLQADARFPEDMKVLRVLPGAHAGQFAMSALLNEEYTVKPESNRMGLRLTGPELRTEAESALELLSAPVCPGTVQVTHDGLPIVLGVDAQTIGGYPRVAHVIAADLDKLGQLRAGDRLRFQQVDRAHALELLRQRSAWLRQWVTRLLNSPA